MGEDLEISRDRVLAGITISLYIYICLHTFSGRSESQKRTCIRRVVLGSLFGGSVNNDSWRHMQQVHVILHGQPLNRDHRGLSKPDFPSGISAL